MKYVITYKKSAAKELRLLSKVLQRKIIDKLEALAENPKSFEKCKKLSGHDSTYRIRIDPYRVIYEVKNTQLTILVIKIAHRQSVYNA